RFRYSAALGATCTGCARPRVEELGSASGGLGVGTGAATLVDLDGDGVPDLVDGSQPGALRIFGARLDASGTARITSTPRTSMHATVTAFPLGDPRVQVLDLDGNGLADLLNTSTGRALCNDGTGDFSSTCDLARVPDLVLEGDADDGDLDPAHTRFLDLDGDRRIDLLRTAGGITVARVLAEDGFVTLAAEPVGADFDTDHLDLADLNGDGLLDLVRIADDGTVRFRLALGRARWTAWQSAEAPAISPSDAPSLELEDLDGDGLADLVIVSSSSVRYALNASDGRFAPFVTLTAADVDGVLPARSATTIVLFADMNANGSTDVVWVERSGLVRALELLPARPNLLTRLENGLGLVTELAWGTLAQHRARDLDAGDGARWPSPTPGATSVLDAIDTWSAPTGGEDGVGLHDVRTFRYAGGFYNVEEHAFRGFTYVSEARAASDAAEAARIDQTWDVGRSDVYRAGMLLEEVFVADGAPSRVLRRVLHTYDDAVVAEASALDPTRPVRHVYRSTTTTVHEEGRPEPEWAVTRELFEHDGFGRRTRTTNLGVVGWGDPSAPRGCAPCVLDGASSGACGAACTGDERVEETSWIDPGARWILDRRASERRHDDSGAEPDERRYYYDGPAFVGLPLGALERGALTRVERFVDATRTIQVQRFELDARGNPVVALDPRGAPTNRDDHRTELTWDADGLHVVRIERTSTTPEGTVRRLFETTGYDPVFDQPVVVGKVSIVGEPEAEPTRLTLDGFGRVIAVHEPGDAADAPTTTYAYELAAPVSRIVTRQRSRDGAAPDLERVSCLDGRLDVYATRTRLTPGRWLEDGFIALDPRGLPARVHETREVTEGACLTTEPTDRPFVATRYDALDRSIETIHPDATLFGDEPSRERVEHLPLAQRSWSADDLDPASDTSDTPTTTRMDGLGRTIAIERLFTQGGTPAVTRFGWDALGYPSVRVDAAGNEKRQRHDRSGRVIEVDDPQTGTTRFTWDDGGNAIEITDARGATLERRFDGLGRLVAELDATMGTEVRYRWDVDPECTACVGGAGELVSVDYPLPEALVRIVGGDGRGRDELAYDDRGRRVREVRRVGRIELETRRELDRVGRELAVVHPGGARIERVLDGAARLVRVPSILDVDYDARGLTSRIRHEDGTEQVFGWDVRGALAELSVWTPEGRVTERRFTHDRSRRLVDVTDDGDVALDVPSAALRAGYDAEGRLTSVERGDESLELAHGPTGVLERITSSLGASSPLHLGAIEHGRAGLVSKVGALVVEHDDAGAMITRGDRTFTWDALGRLVASGDVRYVYGAGPRPVARVEGDALTVYGTAGFELRDGVGVVYVRAQGLAARVELPATAAATYGELTADAGAPDGVVTAAD
ncbi:FG-GAP-like repeat-containing protein, partial [Myxococcota bacterium]|nr:FG-GAP-like repeat-containing protein [Myxococcota bacterium]